MSNIIGSINNELNIIRVKYRETGECSESYTKYYNQIEQPTTVNDVLTGKIIDFNYFGGYSGRLNNPLVYWNGFYIQPFWITYLSDLIAERSIIYNEKFITDINEISEYIFAYKEGFELGYERFDSIEIENKSSVFKSDKLSIEKIVSYIGNHKESDNGGFSFHQYAESKDLFNGGRNCVFRQNGTCSGFMGDPLRHNMCEWCHLYLMPPLQKWKSEGFEGGKYYRAWFIVLANYQIFDEYFHSKLETKVITDHSVLLSALSKYVTGINAVEFTNIIEHHSLTPGTPKASWIGSKADAHRFATIKEMKIPEFNNCFSFPDGTKLRHNDKNETHSPIIDILKNHLEK